MRTCSPAAARSLPFTVHRAGYTLLQKISASSWNVTMISPRNFFLFTPLLASSAIGTLEFRVVVASAISHYRCVRVAFCRAIECVADTCRLCHVSRCHRWHASIALYVQCVQNACCEVVFAARIRARRGDCAMPGLQKPPPHRRYVCAVVEQIYMNRECVRCVYCGVL